MRQIQNIVVVGIVWRLGPRAAVDTIPNVGVQEQVGIIATVHVIVASAAVDCVVALVAGQFVVTGPTEDRVVVHPSFNTVAALTAINCVLIIACGDLIVARPTVNQVAVIVWIWICAVTQFSLVVAFATAVDGVIALVAFDGVVAPAASDFIIVAGDVTAQIIIAVVHVAKVEFACAAWGKQGEFNRRRWVELYSNRTCRVTVLAVSMGRV